MYEDPSERLRSIRMRAFFSILSAFAGGMESAKLTDARVDLLKNIQQALHLSNHLSAPLDKVYRAK
eukprot:CAMPEP_0113946616 /NCGR_PEP_ID=MMETSP1339-20121228/58971_1 /TAXON_ID=94617 /ORGANISM="Fibrocapsa japonica" /LENGTH=65 /DNA_ID=CAMNT_0000952797 /DNA_START=36 /DNA_END=230 /DNA_ORIENTATION=+ /assembly_acc=CAM_ASM_000762